MKRMKIDASYYRQYSADYTLDVPAEAFGGWTKGGIEIDADRTAFVLMHSMDLGTLDTNPGIWRSTDFMDRTYDIDREVFPKILPVIRASPFDLIHVVGGTGFFEHLPGYQRAVELAGPTPEPPEPPRPDNLMSELRQFRSDHAWRGKENEEAVNKTLQPDFAKNSHPQGEEGVAENSHQLLALCREADINHLIYIGFAIDWCLLMAPGGMLDMHRAGIMCSTIRQAVTAVENKETARCQLVKEIGLWRVSLMFGFVFDLDDVFEKLAS